MSETPGLKRSQFCDCIFRRLGEGRMKMVHQCDQHHSAIHGADWYNRYPVGYTWTSSGDYRDLDPLTAALFDGFES